MGLAQPRKGGFGFLRDAGARELQGLILVGLHRGRDIALGFTHARDIQRLPARGETLRPFFDDFIVGFQGAFVVLVFLGDEPERLHGVGHMPGVREFLAKAFEGGLGLVVLAGFQGGFSQHVDDFGRGRACSRHGFELFGLFRRFAGFQRLHVRGVKLLFRLRRVLLVPDGDQDRGHDHGGPDAVMPGFLLDALPERCDFALGVARRAQNFFYPAALLFLCHE